jgi:hypothetical protein
MLQAPNKHQNVESESIDLCTFSNKLPLESNLVCHIHVQLFYLLFYLLEMSLAFLERWYKVYNYKIV